MEKKQALIGAVVIALCLVGLAAYKNPEVMQKVTGTPTTATATTDTQSQQPQLVTQDPYANYSNPAKN